MFTFTPNTVPHVKTPCLNCLLCSFFSKNNLVKSYYYRNNDNLDVKFSYRYISQLAGI